MLHGYCCKYTQLIRRQTPTLNVGGGNAFQINLFIQSDGSMLPGVIKNHITEKVASIHWMLADPTVCRPVFS